MSSINNEAPIPWHFSRKECRIVTAGAIVFAVATIAFVYLSISQPDFIVGHALIGSIATASLIASIVGMVLYSMSQRRESARFLEEISNAPKIEVEEIELKNNDVASLDYINQVREQLPTLFNGLEDFLVAFVESYYKSNSANPQHLDKVRSAVKMMSEQIDQFLQNPKEILRVAISVAFSASLNPQKMSLLLQGTESQVIAGLSTVLTPPEQKEFEEQHLLLQHILQVLCSQARNTDGNLRGLIRLVKENHEKLAKANTDEAKLEADTNYQNSLTEMIDYLYTNATISEEKIEQWTSHLVPPFLENWRESLFEKISVQMKSLNAAFGPQGFLNDSGWKRKLKLGKSIGRRYVNSLIVQKIASFPLIPERKKVLGDAAKNLFTAFIDPIIGLFETSHPYRKKTEEIIGHNSFSAPKVQVHEWKAYIDAYGHFFHSLAKKLME